MNTVNRYPFSIFNAVQRDLEQGLQRALKTERTWTPAVEVIETNQQYTLLFDVPGVSPDAIDVSTHENVLSIKGKREAIVQENDEGTAEKVVKMSERHYGEFARYFTLPKDADAENITAKHVHGVLQLSIKKQKKQEPKRITIDVSGE